jgi:hypothetical protein
MLTAIAMGAALAHLFELPNKINLGAADYLTVQRNYDNWWIVGLSVPLAVLSVLALTVTLRGTGASFSSYAHNGNIPTQRELFSMCWRWARSLCLFSTGALCQINSA